MDGIGVSLERLPAFILYLNPVNARHIDDRQQEFVFVGDIECVKHHERVIASEVWLDLRKDAIEERGTGDVYFSPAKRSLRFRRSPPYGKFGGADDGGRRHPLNGVDPGVIDRRPEIVDYIASDQCDLSQKRRYAREIVLDRLRRNVRIDLDAGSVTVWQGINSGCEIGNVFLGPVKL
jgi:hypothetical protein